MRVSHSFGKGLAFAALASLGLPAAWLLLGSLLGVHTALRCYLAAVVVVYAIAISPNLRRAFSAALLSSVLALAALVVTSSVAAMAAACAGALAAVRSGLLYRADGLRGVAFEVALGGAGLALAAYVGGGGLLGTTLAVWSFFLVQSLYFAVAGMEPRSPGQPEASDPFEVARSRLQSLLEEEPG